MRTLHKLRWKIPILKRLRNSQTVRLLGASAILFYALFFLGVLSGSKDEKPVFYGGNCTIENRGYR
jgi:hypothetical protein